MNNYTENVNIIHKNVKVAIKSTLYDIEYGEEFKGIKILSHIDESENFIEYDDNSDMSIQNIRCIYDGIMRIDGSRIEIEYDESEESGLGSTKTFFSLDTDNRGIVTLSRRGETKSCLVFNLEARRQMCSYSISDIPMMFCVVTHSIVNNVDENGGKLEFDYELEVNGEKIERNITSIHFLIKE